MKIGTVHAFCWDAFQISKAQGGCSIRILKAEKVMCESCGCLEQLLVWQSDPIKTGFAVARADPAPLKVKRLTRVDIALFLRSLPETGASILGTWYDKQEGIWYIEFSEIVDDLSIARWLGTSWGQKAVWDFARGKEILLSREEVIV